jgi:hypothetical protein
MNVCFVVNHARDWPFAIEGVRVITAREYITDPAFSEQQPARIVNLCRTDRYQGRGYYVSLLAEARGHRVMPEVKTLGDLQSQQLDRLLGNGFDDALQRALAANDDAQWTIEAWFGRDPERHNDALAQQLFAATRIPLARATFARESGRWRLREIGIVNPRDVPARKHARLVEIAAEFVRRGNRQHARVAPRESPAIAILYDADEP